MKRSYVFIGLLAFLLFAVSACNRDSQSVDQERDELRQDIKNMQMRVNARLDELRMDIHTASEHARVEIERQTREMENAQAELQEKLDEIEDAASDTWTSIKNGVRSALDDIEHELEKKSDKGDGGY